MKIKIAARFNLAVLPVPVRGLMRKLPKMSDTPEKLSESFLRASSLSSNY